MPFAPKRQPPFTLPTHVTPGARCSPVPPEAAKRSGESPAGPVGSVSKKGKRGSTCYLTVEGRFFRQEEGSTSRQRKTPKDSFNITRKWATRTAAYQASILGEAFNSLKNMITQEVCFFLQT